jgi:hypothetical protein
LYEIAYVVVPVLTIDPITGNPGAAGPFELLEMTVVFVAEVPNPCKPYVRFQFDVVLLGPH